MTISAPPAAEATTVGNYFVSNYPPYSFWTADGVPAAVAALDQPPRPGTDLGIYLHIPFCRKRCHFCYFRVYTDKKNDEIQGYLDAALAELAAFAKRPAITGRQAAFVYFGGGTPSFLSVEQLEALTDGMKALVPWDRAEEVTFECEPGTLTDRKIDAIRRIGVTRLSLGVENFDDHILETNGRAHLSQQVYRAYERARGAGFPQINIDLIAGMMNETEDNWRQCIAKTIALDPDSVTIYQMEIPYNTTIYKQMKAEGKITAPVADWATKRRWVADAFAALEGAGYTVASAYTAVKDPARTTFVYRDRLWAGADLLGLGVASFSHISGTHFQNLHDFAPYVQRVTAGDLPLARAYTPDDDERLIREFILQLKTGHIDTGYFTAKFGVDPQVRFAGELAELARQGFAQVDGTRLTLTREALLQVDRLLHGFFLPRHAHARYA
ncbi:coproporphyrinogen III oxidase [Planctomycetota bacterium]|nr:coproporphyrinogen III oxidase [Planctomycetota bacterium]